MIKKLKTVFLVITTFAIFECNNSLAATTSSTVTSTANVAASCGFNAANYTLPFGTYTNSANSYTAATASTVVGGQCTSGTTYSVSLNAGTTSGATVTNRLLAGPSSATLAYGIFTDSGFTTNAGTNFISGATATSAAFTFTLYGRIPAGLNPSTTGAYSDVVTMTISY